MSLPLSFRVVALHATEGGPHVVTIREVRHEAPSASAKAPTGAEFALEVASYVFPQLSIGQHFDLVPAASEAKADCVPAYNAGPIATGRPFGAIR